MLTLDTEAGPLTISRAGLADYDAVMAILREAADWLSARGSPPWNHWYMDTQGSDEAQAARRHHA